MTIILKSTFAAAAIAMGVFSANAASANCGLPHGGMSEIGNSEASYGGDEFRRKNKRGGMGLLRDLGPSFGILEGGARVMIVIPPKRKGPPVVAGKNNCDHLKRQIAAGERRLAQMNERLDQMLGDFQVKKRVSTRADVGYSADAIVKLDDSVKDMERALKKLRKKLKKCEEAQWF
jgi:hypothetical protein